MLTEVQDFKPTNLQEVTVIVHPSDRESVEVSVKTRFKNHKNTNSMTNTFIGLTLYYVSLTTMYLHQK